MKRLSRSVLASLLATALLAAPGGALASPRPMDLGPEQAVESVPAAPPTEGGQGAGVVAPKLTRDEAIKIAKEFFEIPAELGAPNVGISQDQNGAVWGLDWQSPSKQAEWTNINVRVDGLTGAILSYSRYSSQQDESLQLSFTRAEAKAKATQWFERLVPAEERAALKAVENPFNLNYWGGTTYDFHWALQIDGYPAFGQGVNITIDARTGTMQAFGRMQPPSKPHTKPEPVLSQAEAEAHYAKQLPMNLEYQRITKPGTDESEWRLVYRPIIEFPSMDQNGKLLGSSGKPLDMAKIRQVKPVPASEQPYQKPAKPLEQGDALKVAQRVSGRQDAPLSSAYSEYGEETKRSAWDFTWAVEAKEGVRIRVRIDAETGLLTEYYHWTETKPFDKGEKPHISQERAQEVAIQFLRTYRPDLAGSVQAVLRQYDWDWGDSGYQPTEYYINFERLHAGIPIASSPLSVQINARTGAVVSFWYSELDEKSGLPSAEGVISADAAMGAFLKHQGITAGWATFWNPETSSNTDPQLVWRPVDQVRSQGIDAFTGAPIDWEGRDLIEAQRYPTDIKGDPAEREIELLWSRGILDLKDGKFLPNQSVAADDLVRWIVLSRGMRPFREYDFALRLSGAGESIAKQAAESPSNGYYGAALQSGIILPEDLALIKDLTGPVPRELFALWSARAMGYGRIAKMEAKIEMGFADKEEVGAKYRNSVALLAGLGVVSGDAEGKFEPQRSLTRAEAARILFAVTAR